MSYTINARMLPYEDKHGLHKICIYIYCNGVQAYPGTEIKIKPEQWKKGMVADHPHKDKMNAIIKADKNLYEGRLLEALKHRSEFSKDELLEIITGRKAKPSQRFILFTQTFIDQMRGKLSEGRLEHYETIINKVAAFDERANLSDVNGAWLQRFENALRNAGLKSSTIMKNIKLVKAVVRAAEAQGLTIVNFKGYSNLKVTTAEAEFLNEDELQNFFDVVRAIKQPAHKLAGYYFLLSCFTGLRLGNAKKFNYSTHVKGKEIFVRANKNGKPVTIPLYTDLSEVLEYIQDKPFHLSEQKARDYVKEIASLAGIRKHVKYHSSRHTAASLFLSKGLSLTEVATIIGDTEAVTKIYSHIDKQKLSEKIKKVMG